MKFVPHVPDAVVTDLVYRHMPSWHAVACYFDWRRHYGNQWAERERARYGERLSNGAVLTEAGWLLPRSAANPRVIEQAEPSHFLSTGLQAWADAEVAHQQIEHETAVLDEDMAVFAAQWLAVVGRAPEDLARLLDMQGSSEEREAFMARWHGDHRAH